MYFWANVSAHGPFCLVLWTNKLIDWNEMWYFCPSPAVQTTAGFELRFLLQLCRRIPYWSSGRDCQKLPPLWQRRGLYTATVGWLAATKWKRNTRPARYPVTDTAPARRRSAAIKRPPSGANGYRYRGYLLLQLRHDGNRGCRWRTLMTHAVATRATAQRIVHRLRRHACIRHAIWQQRWKNGVEK